MKYLKNKLIVFISLLLVVTVAALTAVSSIMYYKSSMSQAEESSSELVAAYSQSLNMVMKTYRGDIQSAAAESAGVAAQDIGPFLDGKAKQYGFNYLETADAAGKNSRGDSIADKPFFTKAKAGETYISNPALNSSGKLALFVAAPISGTDKILYGEFPYTAFSDVLNRIKIGENGYAFCIDADGYTVLHPNEDNVANPVNYFELAETDESYKPTAAIFRRMISGETGIGYSFYNGVRRLVGFTTLDGPEGWSVAVTRPVTQVEESLKTTLEFCVAAGVALLIISVLLTGVFSRRITRPIVIATRRIEELEHGDLSTGVENVKGRDEGARLTLATQNTIRTLKTYIGDISAVLSGVAARDLTVRSGADYAGDFAPIQAALTKIVQSLNETLEQISQSSAQVRSGAEQMAIGGQSLAENSSEQAAAAEQVQNSLDLVSNEIQETARHSLSMQDMTKAALQETELGNAEMQKMLKSMQSIDSFSKKIQDIIRYIDDISAQTNILAINAAVEAAHAGEAGKGFSVVAEEVRQLAAKSAEAAKNTAELIENTLVSVAQGMRNAQEAAGAIEKIVEQTKSVGGLVDQVAESLGVQAQRVSELTEGVKQISDATQANSATAQESAATSEELLGQMQLLDEMVSEFKMD